VILKHVVRFCPHDPGETIAAVIQRDGFASNVLDGADPSGEGSKAFLGSAL